MVLTSFKENCIIKIQPKEFKSRQRVLWLSFWAEVRALLNNLFKIPRLR